MLLFGKILFFFEENISILNNRFATKDNACQAICHIHGSEVNGYIAKCGWGRDESTNSGNNNNQSTFSSSSGGGGGMSSQSYNNNNQYDSVS